MTTEYISLRKSNCKNCYKCIRNCPVKSIRFSGSQAHIVSDECILCGTCYVVCPQNAKQIASSLEKAKIMLAEGTKCILSVAPSFAAAYPGFSIASIRKAAKALGFEDAEETAIGAQIVAGEYDRLVENASGEVIISTCCPTINLLVQRHYPQLLGSLAHVMSPMRAHARNIKSRYPGSSVIFVGPCVSKKQEADAYGDTDCVLTFDEFDTWLGEKSIRLEKVSDDERGGISRLFPTTGGILKSMKKPNSTYSYLSIDGVLNCASALEDIACGKIARAFIEMSSCVGSCSQGPELSRKLQSPVSAYCSVDRYAFGSKAFDIAGKTDAIRQDFSYMAPEKRLPTEDEIKEILAKIGKTRPEDELNCSCCGYNTCREKAIAVFQGKAELTMCLPFIKEKSESLTGNILFNTPNGILILNEQLEVQQINQAARKMMNIRDAGDILGENVIRILDPTDFEAVLSTGRAIRDKRTYLAEYMKYVEQTIVYDRSYHSVLCFMRDVTEEETERAKRSQLTKNTAQTADKVVEKQMRIVQEIASLLGETAAETKIALTKLKESLDDD